ncbi:hypothetical protein BDM02DRAFT_3129096 [Thelephora ganbajun]|uniref:Uncharacterized protein n=1 Tax=Thelephora ganbajun TaxID=370292 RepID=A0ACB6ZG45_THEGA|nr:hypothetical protein BDM02DRAFT_3129096 [Thelephora ganbajun]
MPNIALSTVMGRIEPAVLASTRRDGKLGHVRDSFDFHPLDCVISPFSNTEVPLPVTPSLGVESYTPTFDSVLNHPHLKAKGCRVGAKAALHARAKGAIVIGTASMEGKTELAKDRVTDSAILNRTGDPAEGPGNHKRGRCQPAALKLTGKNITFLRSSLRVPAEGGTIGAKRVVSLQHEGYGDLRAIAKMPGYAHTPEGRAKYTTPTVDVIQNDKVQIDIFREYRRGAG